MRKAYVFKPDTEVDEYTKFHYLSVFLAGTIEMGNSVDWQAKAERRLADLEVNVFNPRRVVAPEDDRIVQQITWELDRINFSQFIFMYLAANTVSPISLYELGLLQGGHAAGKTVILCCDHGYTRKNNVMVTTSHELFKHPNIQVTHSFEGGLLKLKEAIKKRLHC